MSNRVWTAGLAVCLALTSVAAVAAEWPWKRTPKAPDASPGATVSQVVGASTLVTIEYHRPGVKGRDVWGITAGNMGSDRLVPRDGDPRPWRAGANEATTLECSGDILIQGETLPAGKYAVFMVPSDGEWTIIFNSKPVQWGSFRYVPEDDVLKVKTEATEDSHVEWLMYGFEDLSDGGATAYLRWEKVKVPFRVEAPSAG